MIDPELLALLVCPVDHATVTPSGDALVCSRCGRRYPVRDGIPVMLVEEICAEAPAGDVPGRVGPGAAEPTGERSDE